MTLCCFRVFSTCLDPFLFTKRQTEVLTSETVCNVCLHQRIKRSPFRVTAALVCYNLWNSSHCAATELFCIDVQREAAQPSHTFERWMEEQMKRHGGWIRVHSIRMQRKALFPALFLLAHWQSVWDLVWSASVRSLQSPSHAACMHTARDGRGDTGFLSGGTMENQPGKNSHTNKHSPCYAAACTIHEHHSVKT